MQTKIEVYVPETWRRDEFLCNGDARGECLKVKSQDEMVPDSGYEYRGRAHGLCEACFGKDE